MSREIWMGAIIIVAIAGIAGACGPDDADPTAMGETLYAQNCATCHGAEGTGEPGVYPPLAGSEFVMGEPEPLIELVLSGRGGMPPFGGDLNDREVAAVLSYIRNAWGNDAPEVSAGQVEAAR